jgi:glucose-6-phosphate 1-dehydrogenase
MEFCYSCQHGPNTPEAYENLLLEAVEGDRRSFVRYDESEVSWKIVESLHSPKPFIYPPDSFPREIDDFIGEHRWYEPE